MKLFDADTVTHLGSVWDYPLSCLQKIIGHNKCIPNERPVNFRIK